MADTRSLPKLATPPLRFAALAALSFLFAACDYPEFSVRVAHDPIVLGPGESRTVLLTGGLTDYCLGHPVLVCEDLSGQVIDYVVQHLPASISHTLDYSLRSPSTPDVARLTFTAAANVVPETYTALVHATVAGRSIGARSVDVIVLPAADVVSSARPVDIGAGADTSFAILDDGTAWAWGGNTDGQLGVGDRRRHLIPKAVGVSDVAFITGSKFGPQSNSAAIDTSGRLWAIGRGGGELGIAVPNTTVPVERDNVGETTDVPLASAALGPDFSIALDAVPGGDGAPQVWGGPEADAVLQSSRYANLDPDQARLVGGLGLSTRIDVAAGADHALVLTADGQVHAWGRNDAGQLGVEMPEVSEDPLIVASLPLIRSVAAGWRASLALADDGSVWAWGDNNLGLLGDDTSYERPTPAPVPGLPPVVQLSVGENVAIALATDGTVWQWPNGDARAPAPLSGLRDVTRVVAGERHGLALHECGQIWGWGISVFGAQGWLTQFQHSRPMPVQAFTDDGNCPQYSLAVIVSDTIGVNVVADDGTVIACERTECRAVFDAGATVTFTVNSFNLDEDGIRWEGDCQGTGATTSVVMDGHRRCIAVLDHAAADRFLVTADVTGDGTVTSTGNADDRLGPSAIACGETCSAIFVEGTEVTFTATPATGGELAAWGGDCGGSATTATITVTRSMLCSASFREERPPGEFVLSISPGGDGSGTVTSNPAGIDCGADCSEDYPEGTIVELTPTPADGSVFAGWAGSGCPDSAGSGFVEMTSDIACAAFFDLLPTEAQLSVSIDEIVGEVFTVTGRVMSSPAGIDCGLGATDCAEVYAIGTTVVLMPEGDQDFVFYGWNGDPECADAHTTGIAMDEAHHCRATFDTADSTSRSTVTFSVTGNGNVATTDGEVRCPDDCTAIFRYTDSVVVHANPDNGNVLLGWGGDCAAAGTASPITLDIVGDTECTATFGPPPATANVTVDVQGPGTASIWQDGVQLSGCTATGSACTADVVEGTDVQLVWNDSGPGQSFVGWAGDCNDAPQTSLVLTVDGDTSCTAVATD